VGRSAGRQPWEHQGYRPWNNSTRSSLVENAAFSFWRIGFDAVGNNPIAVLVGVAVITVLVYNAGWVIRGFARFGGGPLQSPKPSSNPQAPDDLWANVPETEWISSLNSPAPSA